MVLVKIGLAASIGFLLAVAVVLVVTTPAPGILGVMDAWLLR